MGPGTASSPVGGSERKVIMTTTDLISIFEGIRLPSAEATGMPFYAVTQVPGYTSYFVGKDRESLACFLVSVNNQTGKPHPPIQLENLDAQFGLRCHLRKTGEIEHEGIFTVIRCRDNDNETMRYFLSVCETILRILGDKPTHAQIAMVVNRLVSIFQRIRRSPTRSLNGLFGELYFLLRSTNTARSLAAWRTVEGARFDFSCGDVRLDIKATGSRSRIHTFSYEQCNPPSGTIAIVASLHVEQISGGSSIRTIIEQIETQVSNHPNLILKLHETVAATLGASLNDGLSRRYDMHLAESSLQFFCLEDVPAIRDPLPAGVSNVHFRSDLSTLPSVSFAKLINSDPTFLDLLPSTDVHLRSD